MKIKSLKTRKLEIIKKLEQKCQKQELEIKKNYPQLYPYWAKLIDKIEKFINQTLLLE